MLAEINFNPDVLFALAAILTALGGILATRTSIKMKRMEQKKTDDEDCFHKLKLVREEAEAAAAELHERRMRDAEI